MAFLISRALKNSSMNIDTNWGPLLLIIFFGILYSFYMLSQYILATSAEEIEVMVAISLIIFEK